MRCALSELFTIGRRFGCVGAILVLSLVAWPTAARADAALEEGLSRLASRVAEFLKSEGARSITIGDFTALPQTKASGGRGIMQTLAEKLREAQIDVGDKAPFQLVGRFSAGPLKDHPEATFDSLALKIRAEIFAPNEDEAVKIFSISVFGDSALQLGGATADFPPRANEARRQEEARKSLENPQAAVVGDETRPTATSAFGVTVLVNGAPRRPVLRDGRSFVELGQGEEYAVRIHNRAPFEAAATLTIDGLNLFTFSEVGKFGGAVLVGKNSEIDIPGWFINLERSDAFVITSYPESAAGQQGVTSSLGTITVSFAAAWDPKDNPPPDEVNPKSAEAATGRGRQVDKQYEVVQRVTGRTRAVVSVRYDR